MSTAVTMKHRNHNNKQKSVHDGTERGETNDDDSSVNAHKRPMQALSGWP